MKISFGVDAEAKLYLTERQVHSAPADRFGCLGALGDAAQLPVSVVQMPLNVEIKMRLRRWRPAPKGRT